MACVTLLRPLLPSGAATIEAAIGTDPVLVDRCVVEAGVVIVARPTGGKAQAELLLHLAERCRAEGLSVPDWRWAQPAVATGHIPFASD